MLILKADGSPAPATFTVGAKYLLTVESGDSYRVLSFTWSLARRAESHSAGTGPFHFEPQVASVFYLDVVAIKENGQQEETVFILPTTASGLARTAAAIRWSNRVPALQEPLTARIELDSSLPAKSIAWSLLLNNVPILSGTGPDVVVAPIQPGIYRIQATVIDSTGGDTYVDSAVSIGGFGGVVSSITPPQPGPTLQYLGEVYSPRLVSDPVYCTSLPTDLTSISATSYLLPGTEYVQLELDGVADDEVVVRTQTGNWTLVGPPAGLSNETLPYDYQHHRPYLPAPLDLKLRYSVDLWNVHGTTAAAQNFRVKIKCYRQGAPLFQYTPCAWSAYPGGEGARQRRMMTVITQADIEGDADLHLNRIAGVVSYTLPDLTELMATKLETTGAPDQVFQDDRFFTAQTVACHYEADGARMLKINGIYGVPGVRPGYLDFGQADYPRLVQRVKRLYGKLILFVAAGGFAQGSTVTVRVRVGASVNYHDYQVQASQTVYAPDFNRYLKVGEVPIDLADAEFGRYGLVFEYFVNEAATVVTVPPYSPLPSPGEDVFYSTVNAPTVIYEGACFTDPVPVAAFSGSWAANGQAISSCGQVECGPVGLYCYTELSGSGTLFVTQPLGFPAPYVAPQDDQTHCYGNPAFIFETPANIVPPVFSYSGTSGCGVGYVYSACGGADNLAVIYPIVAAPHAFVSYGSVCYGFVGSVPDLRPYQTVLVSSVTAVSDCQDYACTGSNAVGPSLVYQDVATLQKVNVNFSHLDRGVPRFGAVSPVIDPGYGQTPARLLRFVVTAMQSRFDVLRVLENATVRFRLDPVPYHRQLIVIRAGQRLNYSMQPGLPSLALELLTGDVVQADFYGLVQSEVFGEATVRYEKVVELPRLYHTAVVAQADKSAIKALGFCGVYDRDDYTFYGNLPGGGPQTLPNPDSRVTVQGTNTPEMILLQAHNYGEVLEKAGIGYYDGRQIAGPMTFRFYALRDRGGQHGEMDLWLESDQPFPAYLKASPYTVLAYGSWSYRRDAQDGDVTRRGLRVVTSTAGIQYPGVYASATGERIAAMSIQPTVTVAGQTFAFTGTYDRGVSELVERP